MTLQPRPVLDVAIDMRDYYKSEADRYFAAIGVALGLLALGDAEEAERVLRDAEEGA